MTDLHLKTGALQDGFTMDLLQTPSGQLDETQALRSAVLVALGTDRTANADDELPDLNSDDRRGWWGDTDAATIWGGWSIGSRLWLLERAKITGQNARSGSTVARVEQYIREALQPFVEKKIASKVTVTAERNGLGRIDARVVIYRGPKSAIELEFQSLWDEIGNA
ncbi:Mu-like prophage protein gp46 [Faunimonas pinastri]|uniref:Mu-like prophage protein gp46 n=1 Tax=Faunimonas pinastri TaxID=1855383 RepID=A0A1H9Q8Q5_9HYPH|nr:phage GP46 family protein [Faunimonas pinastri]SER56778.1 Mu-like prophage protein gp46 [Faunimonas pinastri]